MTAFAIDSAQPEEFESIFDLLKSYNLITQDIDLKTQKFITLKDDKQICAIGAIECHQPFGLIRSVAVNPEKTRLGYARKIVEKLEEIAVSNNITALYLLTESAEVVFAKLGYEQIDRESVPKIIKLTNQFSDLCPASATVMYKPIIPSI